MSTTEEKLKDNKRTQSKECRVLMRPLSMLGDVEGSEVTVIRHTQSTPHPGQPDLLQQGGLTPNSCNHRAQLLAGSLASCPLGRCTLKCPRSFPVTLPRTLESWLPACSLSTFPVNHHPGAQDRSDNTTILCPVGLLWVTGLFLSSSVLLRLYAL